MDLFAEIKEDLSRADWAERAKKYGVYVVAVAVAIVLIISVIMGWRYIQTERRQKEGAILWEGMQQLNEGKRTEALEILAPLQSKKGTIPALAKLRIASLYMEEKKYDEARTIYTQISEERGLDEELLSLARLHSSISILEDQSNADEKKKEEAIKNLETLAVEGKPWRYTALEQLAFYRMREGDNSRALALFEQIQKSPEAPETMRNRTEPIYQKLQISTETK